jgi:hypothetical protein
MLGDVQYIDAEVRGGSANTALGRVSVAGPVRDGPARLLVRPEWIVPCGDGVGATVTARQAEGALVRLALQLEDGSQLMMAAASGWVATVGTEVSVGLAVSPPSFTKGEETDGVDSPR